MRENRKIKASNFLWGVARSRTRKAERRGTEESLRRDGEEGEKEGKKG